MYGEIYRKGRLRSCAVLLVGVLGVAACADAERAVTSVPSAGIGSGGDSAAGAVSAERSQAYPTVTVYKSPSCGCCNDWIEHLRDSGFPVEAENRSDMGAIKARLRVPHGLASCHTAQVEGYVIEGHVPAGAVKRLLEERPEVIGLSVPGMPIGSPGMEMGGHVDPYDVLSFSAAGQTVFESHP